MLLAPSWYALQQLISIFEKCCNDLCWICNVNKTKCAVVNPLDKTRIVSKSFSHFCINGQFVQFVDELRYLGHIITSNLHDDADVNREIRDMYMLCEPTC